MRTSLFFLVLLLTACGTETDDRPAATPLPPALSTLLGDYATAAETCAAAVNTAPVAESRRCAAALLDLAAAITPGYAQARPHCAAYLQAALAIREEWSGMGVDAIEADFHRDGRLPANDDRACYHMKDLIVHPATALKLLSLPDPDRRQATQELAEVVAHARALR